MRHHHIHVWLLKASEGGFQTFDHMLLGKTSCVGFLPRCPKEDLCDENVLISRPFQFFKGLSHLNFAFARRVGLEGSFSKGGSWARVGSATARAYLSSVESIDAIVPGRFHAFLYNASLLRASIGQPSA